MSNGQPGKIRYVGIIGEAENGLSVRAVLTAGWSCIDTPDPLQAGLVDRLIAQIEKDPSAKNIESLGSANQPAVVRQFLLELAYKHLRRGDCDPTSFKRFTLVGGRGVICVGFSFDIVPKRH